MKRTPLKRRTRLRPVSDRKRAERTAAQPVVDAVFARDGGCLMARYHGPAVVPGCFGPLTPHHLRKQSARRGGWTERNLVTLCAHHNGWVEDHPDLAHALGLVLRRGDTEAYAWLRMGEAGLLDGAA